MFEVYYQHHHHHVSKISSNLFCSSNYFTLKILNFFFSLFLLLLRNEKNLIRFGRNKIHLKLVLTQWKKNWTRMVKKFSKNLNWKKFFLSLSSFKWKVFVFINFWFSEKFPGFFPLKKELLHTIYYLKFEIMKNEI